MAGKPHPPSAARALVAEAKRKDGRDLHVLLDEARAIRDTGHAADALFSLSADPRLPAAEAAKALEETLRLVERTERGWRQAELLADLARRVPRWRADDQGIASTRARLAWLDGARKLVVALPDGAALSAALSGLAAHVPRPDAASLLDRAFTHQGMAHDDARAVLKARVEVGGADEADFLVAHLVKQPDPDLRARLLGYLHLALARHSEPRSDVLDAALDAARAVPDPDARLETLRALVQHAADAAGLDRLAHAAPALADDRRIAALLGTLAARADKMGEAARRDAWLDEARGHARAIADAALRGPAMAKLAEAFRRAGRAADADALLAEAREAAGPLPDDARQKILARIEAGARAEGPRAGGEARVAAAARKVAADPGWGTRHVLALYDSYEGRIGETHLRAVARAAPLCVAFDLDLALLGFPADDLDRFIAAAARETRVGEAGAHLSALARAGRVRLVAAGPRGPVDWTELGTPVATTSQPDPHKSRDLPSFTHSPQGTRRLCLLVGLGKRGLPAGLLSAVQLHYEITGARVALETATAMGILAERLRALPRPSPEARRQA